LTHCFVKLGNACALYWLSRLKQKAKVRKYAKTTKLQIDPNRKKKVQKYAKNARFFSSQAKFLGVWNDSILKAAKFGTVCR
jgi:hypothetical protein